MAATRISPAPVGADAHPCNHRRARLACVLCTALSLILIAGCGGGSITSPDSGPMHEMVFEGNGRHQAHAVPGPTGASWSHSVDDLCPLDDHGLAFSPSARLVAGSPIRPTGPDGFMCMYTATRPFAGRTQTKIWQLRIVVEPPPAPPADSPLSVPAIPLQTLLAGQTVDLTLPEAVGGAGGYSYTLAPDDCLTAEEQVWLVTRGTNGGGSGREPLLDDDGNPVTVSVGNLYWDAPHRTIIGTVAKIPAIRTQGDGAAHQPPFVEKACRYIATDSAGVTAAKTLILRFHSTSVRPLPSPLALSPLTAVPTLTPSTDMVPHRLPKASGGTGRYTYSMDCGAITLGDIGLSLSPSGVVGPNAVPELSGTPSRSGQFACVFKVEDSATPPDSDEVNVRIKVSGASSLTLTPSGDSLSGLIMGTPMTRYRLPVVSGGVAPYTHELDCKPQSLTALGLSIIPADTIVAGESARLVGTPKLSGTYQCLYSVTDSASPSADTAYQFVELSIAAQASSTSSLAFAPYAQWTRTFTAGSAVEIRLPVATGGAGDYKYSIAHEECLAGERQFVYRTVTNADGSRTRSPVLSADGEPLIALGWTLRWNSRTRLITGTAPASLTFGQFAETVCEYVVEDGRGAVHSQTLRLTFTGSGGGRDPLTMPATTAITDGAVGTSLGVRALPAATGGTGRYTYALSCPQPLSTLGLRVNPAPTTAVGAGYTPTVSGTPTAAAGQLGKFRCTWTATASGGTGDTDATVSQPLEITVAGAGGLALGAFNTAPTLTVGTPLTATWSLPTVTGGTPGYAHTVACGPETLAAIGLRLLPAVNLPTGLAGRIVGTPKIAGTYQCLYTVTDSTAPTPVSAYGYFEFTVAPRTTDSSLGFETVSPSPWSSSFDAGAVVDIQLPLATGGLAPYTYSLAHPACLSGDRSLIYQTVTKDGTTTRTPVLGPDGLPVVAPGWALRWNAATRRITGTAPSTLTFGQFVDTVCEYVVTDDTGAVYSETVRITFVGSGVGRQALAMGAPTPVTSAAVGVPLGLHALPAASGGTERYSYSLTCPATLVALGLRLDPGSSGTTVGPAYRPTLSGTPTAHAGALGDFVCTYTVTEAVSDQATGDSVSHPLRITVGTQAGITLPAPTAPSGVGVGTALTSATRGAFPAATGGTGPYAYTLSCAPLSLSDVGLRLNLVGTTPTLSGTPTRAGVMRCRYIAIDSAGLGRTRVVPDWTIGAARSAFRLPLPAGPLLFPNNKTDFSSASRRLPAAIGVSGTPKYALEDCSPTVTITTSATEPTNGFWRKSNDSLEIKHKAVDADATGADHICAWTVTDDDGDTNTTKDPTFTVPVRLLVAPSSTEVDIRWNAGDTLYYPVGVPLLPVSLGTVGGGSGLYSHSVFCAPELPSGLRLTAAGDSLSLSAGTTSTQRTSSCSWIVTDTTDSSRWDFQLFSVVLGPGVPVSAVLTRGTWKWPGGTGSIDVALATVSTTGETPPLEHHLVQACASGAGCGMPWPGYRQCVGADSGLTSADWEFDSDTGRLKLKSGRTVPSGVRNVGCLYVVHDSDSPNKNWAPAAPGYSRGLPVGFNIGCDSAQLSCTYGQSPTTNPVHDALLPDHGRRASAGAGRAIAHSVSSWANLPLGAAPTALTPAVSAESFGGRLDGFAISGSTRAVDVTAVLPAGTDWLLGVNARSVETTSTYYAYAVDLNYQGYYRGDYDSEILSVTPFVATRLPGGAHAYAAAGVGYGTMRHRDVDSGRQSNGRYWSDWNRAPLDLRTWHLGGGLPLGDAGPGLLAFAARVDGFSIQAEPNAVMRPVADRGRPYRYSGTTWTAGADWTHQSRWQPSLHVDWEHDAGDGTEGSRLVVGAAIDAAGIVHPRLALELDARHVRDVDAAGDDGWRVRGGLRWSAAPSGHGMSAELGTTVRTEDDGTVATLGGELRWRGVAAAPLGTVEPYGGFEQFVSGSTRHRLGLRLLRGDSRTISAEAWQEPDVDDFGVRLVFRSDL